MNNENSIEIRGVTKTYRMYKNPLHRLLQRLSFKKLYHDITVLSDINIIIKKGEVVGIVGQNGAGKSTLLKMITGITSPTKGQIEINGKISSLLELGTGFNNDFTGLENIYLNSSFLQRTKVEIDASLQDIITFADIGDYINEPLKTYSSGMKARLAFAIAISVNPDILIIDEVLSVGDVFFREKCFRKFNEFKERGITILFVTHSMDQIVKHTTRAFMLHKGKLVWEGIPADVTSEYIQYQNALNDEKKQKEIDSRKAEIAVREPFDYELNPLFNRYADITGTMTSLLKNLVLRNRTRNSENLFFEPDDNVEIEMHIKPSADLMKVSLLVEVSTLDGLSIEGFHCSIETLEKDCQRSFMITFKNNLNNGDYFISISFEMKDSDNRTVNLLKLDSAFHFKVLKAKNAGLVRFPVVFYDVDEEAKRGAERERRLIEEENRKKVAHQKLKEQEDKRKQDEDRKRNNQNRNTEQRKDEPILKSNEIILEDCGEPFTMLPFYNSERWRYGSGELRFVDFRFKKNLTDSINFDDELSVDIEIANMIPSQSFQYVIGAVISNKRKERIAGTNSVWAANQFYTVDGTGTDVRNISININLNKGLYYLSFIVARYEEYSYDRLENAFVLNVLNNKEVFVGDVYQQIRFL